MRPDFPKAFNSNAHPRISLPHDFAKIVIRIDEELVIEMYNLQKEKV
jgi:hypothetical protein